MSKELNVEDNAPWKQRYTASSIGSAQIACLCPTKGILNIRRGTLQWVCLGYSSEYASSDHEYARWSYLRFVYFAGWSMGLLSG